MASKATRAPHCPGCGELVEQKSILREAARRLRVAMAADEASR